MVEPVSLSIGAVVTALVLKAAEKTGEEGVKGGWSVVGRLVDRLRHRFQERGDTEGEAALARIQDPPAGERQMAALTVAIDRQAQQDPTFAEELRDLVKRAESGGVKVQQVTQTAWGNQNVQIADATGSRIDVKIGHPEK